MMENAIVNEALERFATPFYVFDTDAAGAQIDMLKSFFGGKVGICYAMKANPFIIGEVQQSADFFEVCSPGEFRICERAGIDPRKIVLSGVYKKPEDIAFVVGHYGAAVTYTVESLRQWELLCGCAKRCGVKIRTLLRLTNGSQFGLECDEIKQIIQDPAGADAACIEGIQYFSGTQKRTGARTEDEIRLLDCFLRELKDELGYEAQKLEYGPGLPVEYFSSNDGAADEILHTLATELENMSFKCAITLEIGRFIAACCGSYFTGVVDKKCNHGHNYCIIDGGIHQLKYFGQMLAMKEPPVKLWQEKPGDTEAWTVCGCLCTMNDVVLKGHRFSGLDIGSRLIFGKAGAYCPTEGISLFLSRDLPKIILYSKSGGLKLVRDTFETDSLNFAE